ncbi:hypothetical protein RRG08_041148 [Elysia crispata]|uniref:Uncharacterized protein n=1 Tax=Elysia crispata TaxID=231223 RepID=A0AAE1CPL7_9GAST|nr:hypothetical protein RRG08_041148 [Elysia crispata]
MDTDGCRSGLQEAEGIRSTCCPHSHQESRTLRAQDGRGHQIYVMSSQSSGESRTASSRWQRASDLRVVLTVIRRVAHCELKMAEGIRSTCCPHSHQESRTLRAKDGRGHQIYVLSSQ